MIHGVGIDLIDERRLGPLDDPQDPFITKVYTQAEQAQALASQYPRRYYAERFAAKEALFKALRISGDGVHLSEIETLNGEHGAPFIQLYGSLEQRPLWCVRKSEKALLPPAAEGALFVRISDALSQQWGKTSTHGTVPAVGRALESNVTQPGRT